MSTHGRYTLDQLPYKHTPVNVFQSIWQICQVIDFLCLPLHKTAPPHVALQFVKLHRVTYNTDSSYTIKHIHSSMECVAQWETCIGKLSCHVHPSQSLWTHIIEHPHLMYIELLSMVNLFLFGSLTESRFEVGDTSMSSKENASSWGLHMQQRCRRGHQQSIVWMSHAVFSIKEKSCWFLGHLHKAETTLLWDSWLHATRGDLENRMQEDPSSRVILYCKKYVVWWQTD